MTRRTGAPGRRRAGVVGASALALALALAAPPTAAAAPRPKAPAPPPRDAAVLPAQGLKAPLGGGAEEDPASAPPATLPPGASFGSAQITAGAAALNFPGAGMPFLSPQAGGGQAGVAAPSGGTAAGAAGAAATTAGAGRSAPADAPPAAPPPGATFPFGQMALSDAQMSFADSHVASGDAHLAAPAAAALPGGMAFREEGRGLRITLDADVLFDFDKAELRRDAGPRLQKLMEEVSARVPRPAFRVEGHTDWIGSDAYNLRLSARRADSVRDWLVRQGGVPRPAVSTVGYGESRPVAPNSTPDGKDDPEGRQRNRRVELLVTPR